MILYRSKITNKILTENYARCVSDVYGEGTFTKAVQTGILEPLESPSVIDCLRYGTSEVVAVLRYREIHPNTTVKAAREAVRKIKSDMMRDKNRKSKPPKTETEATEVETTESETAEE